MDVVYLLFMLHGTVISYCVPQNNSITCKADIVLRDLFKKTHILTANTKLKCTTLHFSDEEKDSNENVWWSVRIVRI